MYEAILSVLFPTGVDGFAGNPYCEQLDFVGFDFLWVLSCTI